MTRTRWIILAVAAVMTVVVVYFGSQYFIAQMLETRGLRKLIAGKTGKLLGCDAGYLRLHANGRTVWSDGFLGKASPPRSLTELRAASLWARCSLSELWKAKWRIDTLHVRHLQAAYGEAASRRLRRDEFGAPEMYPPSTTESPLEIDLRVLDASELDLYWGKDENSGGEFRRVHAQFMPRGKELAVHADHGTFHQLHWPEARLVQCKLLYAKPNLRIDEAALDLAGKGRISVLGNLLFAEKQSMDLQLKLEQCPIEPFFESPKQRKVAGEFDGTAHIVTEAGQSESRVAGAVSTTNAALHNLDTMDKVAAFTGRKDLAQLKINNAKADYDWNTPTLTVKNFVCEARNVLILEGEFVVREGKIDGEFQLGVAPDLVDKFPGAREDVFTRSARGYLWTQVGVSGPLNKMHDNLKPRLVKAARDHFAKGLLAPILKPGQSIIEAIEGL